MAHIAELWKYPLKGARGIRVRELEVDQFVGVRGDRWGAVEMPPEKREGKGHKPLEQGMHHKKGNFYVCMNTPIMATEVPVYDSFMPAPHGGGALTAEYMVSLAKRLATGDLTVHYSDGKTFSYHDTKGAFVSFGNLATHQFLERELGRSIDKDRWRFNGWLSDLEAFEELSWIDAFPGTLKIKSPLALFRGDDECERCPAINVDPLTGKRDTLLMDLKRVMDRRSHRSPHRNLPQVMGILVAPLAEGLIEVGDEIALAA